MRLALGGLAAGALLAGYSAVSLACDGSCDLKPETPAAFEVVCVTNDCRSEDHSDKDRGLLKPEQSFDVTCVTNDGCRSEDATDKDKRQLKPDHSFDATCMTDACKDLNSGSGDGKGSSNVQFKSDLPIEWLATGAAITAPNHP